MTELRRDMARIQELIGAAFGQTGGLVAMADGGIMPPEKLQRTLEQTMENFEQSVLELRRLCERYSPGVGGYGRRPVVTALPVIGRVELLCEDWLHIRLNTLLPHCRFQTSGWLTDTIRRLLDEYEAQGKALPRYERALMVIDEHSAISGRHVFDQDNKGWKAVNNAVKGRLIPDDDQYTLNVALLSQVSREDTCHITLLEQRDAADFFSLRAGDHGLGRLYDGL
ncbi:hypothetical protein [Intestinimonas butyriciproducens]|uniref:hypothetical protein n=1 Tax=Intestinimonas butyriciproducens TaxID=1297617 RepID=UPI00242D442B